MSSQYDNPPRGPEVSGWAVGGMAFAASGLILIGLFQVIMGIVAIADDEFFVRTTNYTFDLDVTAWGWIHLLIGILAFLMGLGLFRQAPWAGVGAIANEAGDEAASERFVTMQTVQRRTRARCF